MAMAAGTKTILDTIITEMKTEYELYSEVTYIKGSPIQNLRDLCVASFDKMFSASVAAADFAAWAFLPTYPSYVGTSTTSNSIAVGAKTFTTQSGKAFAAGQTILVSSDASPTVNFMKGKVTSYSSTTLVVDVTEIGGSGTKTDWTITVTVAGQGGADDVTP